MKKHLFLIVLALSVMAGCQTNSNTDKDGNMLRADAGEQISQALDNFMNAIQQRNQNVQSIMVMQHGKVIAENWMNGGNPCVPHALHSVSKTFTSISVGLAIEDGLLKLDDKIVDLFPDMTPQNPSEYLKEVSIESLLMMGCGHSYDPSGQIMGSDSEEPWVKQFMEIPVEHKPCTYFWYNTVGTYMLSAAVQKVTGKKVVDYLQDKLFDPLSIEHPKWDESPQGVSKGGTGLYLKTEDLAKTGQCLLQGGKWNGKRIIPEAWVKAMTTKHIENDHFGGTPDWKQGYCYQMWICTHDAVRADGANGQYIILLPQQDAVIVATAELGDMQAELDTIWEFILPALK